MKHCLLFALVLCALILPGFYCEPAKADIGEPVVAMILDESYGDVGTDYNLRLNASATFIGISTGGYIPYSYFWYVDGVATPTSPYYMLVYAATEVGEHSLVLVVNDLYGQSSSDTVLIQVYDPAVPVSPITWGSIKSLFK